VGGEIGLFISNFTTISQQFHNEAIWWEFTLPVSPKMNTIFLPFLTLTRITTKITVLKYYQNFNLLKPKMSHWSCGQKTTTTYSFNLAEFVVIVNLFVFMEPLKSTTMRTHLLRVQKSSFLWSLWTPRTNVSKTLGPYSV